MKKTNNKSTDTKALIAFSAISAIGLLFSYSIRFFFVFVDTALFTGVSFGLFIFAVVSTVFLFVNAYLSLKHKERLINKATKIPVILSEIISVLLIIVPIIILIVDPTSLYTVLNLMKKALPIWIVAVLGCFYILVFPNIKNDSLKKAFTYISVICLCFMVYVSIFPVIPYSFTSGPVVFDNGNGAYSVVFATNDTGTGFVEYELNGDTIRIYDENNGRKNGQSTIHSILVDKDILSGNTYKVGSTRLVDELSYGGRNGKTIISEPYQFNDSFSEDINVLTVSDWHTKNSKAMKAVENIPEDYQAVVLLGDCAPGIMGEADVAKYIISFGYDLSGGTMPVIYTRGNHETRGTAASALSDYLGIDQFYYNTSIGKYNVFVLDSCEDKDDSHPEYGGMVDYKNYRSKMVQWLDTFKCDDKANTIVFCHSREIAIEKDLSEKALNKLADLNSTLLVSGHEHKIIYDTNKDIAEFVDGGINSNGNGTYAASMLKLSPDGINILCYDNKGEKAVDENLPWK